MIQRGWVMSFALSVALVLGLAGVGLAATWAMVLSLKAENPFWRSAANHYRTTIPAGIRTTALLGYGSKYLDTCGGFAFRLDGDFALSLEQDGLDRLQAVTLSPRSREGVRLTYEPWRPTPLPIDWLGDGRWATGMGCFADDDRLFDNRAVYDTVEGPGGFYTSSKQFQIVIFPRQKLLVSTHLK